jgi:hypothetical protein
MTSKLIVSLLVLGLYCSAIDAQPGAPWNGPLWAQKVTHLFMGFDLDGNGLHDDLDVQKLADAYVSWGETKQDQVKATENAMWITLYKNAPPGAPLNATTLILCLSSLGQENMIKDVKTYAPMYFQVIDTSNDELLDITEYSFFFSIFKLPSDVISAAFNTFSNGGTTITQKQYTAGWQEYFTTSNPTDRFNSILAPLNYN